MGKGTCRRASRRLRTIAFLAVVAIVATTELRSSFEASATTFASVSTKASREEPSEITKRIEAQTFGGLVQHASQPGFPPRDWLTAISATFPGTATNAHPSDGAIGVGPSHIVEAVNDGIAVYTKGGTPLANESLNSFFGVPETVFLTDPRVLFDPISQRWFVVALQNTRSTQASYLFYGFSQTADPMSTFCFYTSNQTTGNDTFNSVVADFPGLGFDEFAFYITLARYSWGAGFAADAKVVMLPRIPLFACGGSFSAETFTTTRSLPGSFEPPVLMPTLTYGAAPAEFFVASQDQGGQYVGLWQITGRSTTGTGAVLSFVGNLAVLPYARPQPAPQRGSGTPIDFGDARVISAAVWRNGSLFFTFGVNLNFGIDGVRWYELATSSQTFRQSGLLYFDSGSYGFPAIMVDSSGGITVTASVTGTSFFLGTAVATRNPTDPPGQLAQPIIFASVQKMKR